MSDETNVGGRLALLAPDALDLVQGKIHARMMAEQVPWATQSGFEAATADGRLLGPFNALLYAPETGEAYLNYFVAKKENTTLTKRVHEIVILTVGAAWHSDYELYAHSAVGKKVGLPEPVIQLTVLFYESTHASAPSRVLPILLVQSLGD